MRQPRNLINIQNTSNIHPDLGHSRIRKDEADVQAVVDLLENNWLTFLMLLTVTL